MPDPTDKKKKKVVRVKKKRNGETSVLRVDEKRAARNKKVQEAGVIDNKATSHVGIDKDGNYIAKKTQV